MIIRSISLGGMGVTNVFTKMVNAVTFRTDLKAVKNNSENTSSKIYKQDLSTMKNIKTQHQLFEGLHRPKVGRAPL